MAVRFPDLTSQNAQRNNNIQVDGFIHPLQQSPLNQKPLDEATPHHHPLLDGRFTLIQNLIPLPPHRLPHQILLIPATPHPTLPRLLPHKFAGEFPGPLLPTHAQRLRPPHPHKIPPRVSLCGDDQFGVDVTGGGPWGQSEIREIV